MHLAWHNVDQWQLYDNGDDLKVKDQAFYINVSLTSQERSHTFQIQFGSKQNLYAILPSHVVVIWLVLHLVGDVVHQDEPLDVDESKSE